MRGKQSDPKCLFLGCFAIFVFSCDSETDADSLKVRTEEEVNLSFTEAAQK